MKNIETYRLLYQKMQTMTTEEQRLWAKELEQASTSKEELEETRHMLGFASPMLWAYFYMGEYLTADFGRHHGEIFQNLPVGKQGVRLNVIAPRGSGKSVTAAVLYPLYCIFYRDVFKALDMPYESYIIIMSKTHSMAISRMRDILRHIETHPELQKFKGNRNEGWGVQWAVTSNDICLRPVGRGGQVRGSLFRQSRPSLIIMDDLDDPERVLNPNLRQDDQTWFDTDVMRAGSQDGLTNFINIDTIKHVEAVSSILQNRADWESLFYRAIESPEDLWHPTAEPLWKQWERLYTDMSISMLERQTRADDFYAMHETEMTENVAELWPAMLSYKKVREAICNEGYYAVMREFQNTSHDPTQCLFDMDTAVRFQCKDEGIVRSDGRIVNYGDICGMTVFLDWAGGKDIVDNCYAVATAVAWEPQHGIPREDQEKSLMGGMFGYAIDASLARVGAKKQLEMCFDAVASARGLLRANKGLRVRFGVEGFVQDTWNAQEELIQREFRYVRDERNESDMQLEFLKRQTNKFRRIDTLQVPIANGWLSFHEGLPAEFMKQMSLYPTGEFLDAPDSLEGALELPVRRSVTERRMRRNKWRDYGQGSVRL